MKKEIDAETKKAAEADRKHKVATGDGEGRDRQREARAAKATREGGAGGQEAERGADRSSSGKLLDGYLRQHPDARSRNAEELRNELTLTPR